MTFYKSMLVALGAVTLAACATPGTAPSDESEHEHDPAHDLGILWVKHAAEYEAISAQVYRQATDDLPELIQDTSWSAMPGYSGLSDLLPPAVILDVDETVVSNVDFQLTFERPFANHKLDDWSSHYESRAVRGVQAFVAAARAAGVTVFFVTNRPCAPKADSTDPCPQEKTTVDDIREVGIEADNEHVMLVGERPEWDREKLVRRELIATSYRVIMLIGDDFGDFIPCARKSLTKTCSKSATRDSRAIALDESRDRWGRGWYILPNPMHGSWTSVR